MFKDSKATQIVKKKKNGGGGGQWEVEAGVCRSRS